MPKVKSHKIFTAEAYLKPYQSSRMVYFAEIV